MNLFELLPNDSFRAYGGGLVWDSVELNEQQTRLLLVKGRGDAVGDVLALKVGEISLTAALAK